MSVTRSEHNRRIPTKVAARHWAVFKALFDISPESLTHKDIRDLTGLTTNHVATSVEFLCRHSFADRTPIGGGAKCIYKATGRQATSIEDLMDQCRHPKKLVKARGGPAKGLSPEVLANREPVRRVGGRPTTNGPVRAMAFVRVEIHGKVNEMSYAEANRLYQELSQVFVKGA